MKFPELKTSLVLPEPLRFRVKEIFLTSACIFVVPLVFLADVQAKSDAGVSDIPVVMPAVTDATDATAHPAVPRVEQARNVKKSLLRINATSQSPEYDSPWNAGKTSRGRGAGFVIAGNRVMTNAHVVSNARLLTVEKENDPNEYLAHVEHIAHDCDLAILRIEDPRFFEGTEALEFGEIPPLESEVSAYGYPIGGSRMSVTNGVVSRIDFQPYSHTSIDSHLTIQIDAAINPGNSGGPVLQDGKVVGVAFQGYTGDVAQSTGYMIPTPVIRRFLKDIEDGSYDKYVDLSIAYISLQNPAQRKALGLKENNYGVMVSSVYAKGSADGVLQPGDVLLSIDGHPIFSDGYIEIDNERIEMPEIVERKFLNDPLNLRILRAGEESDVTLTLKPASPFAIQANKYDVKPRYVTFGGLVFQPLDRNFLSAHRIANPRVQYYYNRYIADQLYLEHPEIIILSNILADPVNAYLQDFQHQIVEEINGTKIRTLEDVSKAFKADAEYHVIKLIGIGRPLVLEAKAVRNATPRILERYQISQSENLTES